MTQKLLSAAIFLLAFIALVVLGAAAYAQYLLYIQPGDLLPQRFALLPGIAVSAGVLIAALTFIRERGKTELEQQRHASEVLLTRASEGFRTAVDLLSDRNNQRTAWIRAARTLLQAQRLGGQIRSDEYRLAYRLEEERTRNDLYRILVIHDDKTGERQALPPQFFYGIPDWRNCPTLDEAAIRASQQSEAHLVTIDAVPPSPTLMQLAPHSVIALFDFLKYPEDYDDPLKAVVDWSEDWDSSLGIDQGARRYVAHTKLKVAVGGVLHDIKKKD